MQNEILSREKVREALQKYKPFFNQNKVVTLFFTKVGAIIEVNQAAIDCYGYTREEFLNLTDYDLCALQEYKSSMKNQRDKEFSKGMLVETIHKRKDGSILPVEVHIQSIELEGQTLFMVIVRDQTGKEDRFVKIFQLSPDPMLITILEDLTIVDANNAFVKSLGLPKSEMIGKTSLEIGFWVKAEDCLNFLTKLGKEKTVINYETAFKAKGGKIKLGLISAGIVGIEGIDCIIGVVTDITSKKNFENEIMQLELNNLLLEMAASISHEVRNPMTTVRGYLQLLRKKDEKCSEFRDVFELMVEELDRANELITEFLAIAQKKTGEIQSFNLNDIIKKLLPLLQAEALMGNKFIKIELEDIPKLMLNESEIRQVIINLVKNALDASPINGFVTIKTKVFSTEKKLILSVEDQGSGISQENMGRIGTPFFTTKETGTGLGLAVCYRIIERHQGVMEIETSPFGTIFNVIFNYNSQ